jgi:hypothetical protein
MLRKPLILAIALCLLAAGQTLWSMGQSADIFGPVDLLVEEKKYEEAIDMLRRLLVTAPKKTEAIKKRIADVLLAKADDNIKNQRYNEAFEDASRFWRENPERADEAQKRIRKVNAVREKYNKASYDLYQYMINPKNRADPDYNKEVVRRLEDLDSLDRNNPDSKKTINYLKETSLALVNQDTLKRVMSEARVLVDKGQYVAASRKYLEASELFKPEFQNAGYDEITMSAVTQEAVKAKSAPDSYQAMQSSLESAVARLVAALGSGDIAAIETAVGPAQAALAELERLRSELFASASTLDGMYKALPKQDRSPIEYQYLAILDVLIRGRTDDLSSDRKPDEEKGKPEGVGGTIIAQWDALLDRVDAAAQAGLDAAYAAGESSFSGGRLSEARAAYDRAAALYAPAARVLAWREAMPRSDFVPDLEGIKSSIAAAAAAKVRLEHEARVAEASSRLAVLLASTRSVAGEAAGFVSSYGAATAAKAGPDARVGADAGVGASANQAAAELARKTLGSYRDQIRALEQSLSKEAESASSLAAFEKSASAGGDGRAAAAGASYSSKLADARAEALASEYVVASSLGRVEADFMELEIAARDRAVSAAELLIDGELSTRAERALAGYKDPSPTTSAALLAAEQPRVAALAAWAAGRLALMDGEPKALRDKPEFAAARSRMEAVAARTAELQARRAASLARAEERKKYAREALAEAKKNLDISKAKLASAQSQIKLDKGKGARSTAIRKDFADAKSYLEQALAGVLSSSNADFDGKVWDDYQRQYAQTSGDIDLAKKNFVVDETFRLLGEGQANYEQALFDLAAESLNAAQELWREENDADQEQVKFWQNLVRQASDTNNKREVRQSDALYYDISSYLSEARKLYLRGDGLVKSGDKDGAAKAFESARQNLGFVTRAFPLNSDAGYLNLQILKSTDPDAYKKSLPRRVEEAIALLDTDATSGYSRIADLYKMEPSYPGLKAALEKAEIKVGKRRAPPTKAEQARAAALIAEAEKLRGTGRKDDQAKAEDRLNAALVADPTNKKALSMLREINILKGESVGAKLSMADQAILDQATRDFAARRYNQARDGVNRLLADANKKTREVLKLDNDLKVLGYP